jgi:hypothetical protein
MLCMSIIVDISSLRYDAVETLKRSLTIDNCFAIVNAAMGGAGTEALMTFVGPALRAMIASPQWMTLSPSALSWVLASDDIVINESDLINATVAWCNAKVADSIDSPTPLTLAYVLPATYVCTAVMMVQYTD